VKGDLVVVCKYQPVGLQSQTLLGTESKSTRGKRQVPT